MQRVAVITALAVLAGASLRSQSGSDLFQQALSKERAEGQIDAAIQIYERIVKEFASDRPLAAKALLQIGRAYERVHNPEAVKAYDRLLREYGPRPDAGSDVTPRAKPRCARPF